MRMNLIYWVSHFLWCLNMLYTWLKLGNLSIGSIIESNNNHGKKKSEWTSLFIINLYLLTRPLTQNSDLIWWYEWAARHTQNSAVKTSVELHLPVRWALDSWDPILQAANVYFWTILVLVELKKKDERFRTFIISEPWGETWFIWLHWRVFFINYGGNRRAI